MRDIADRLRYAIAGVHPDRMSMVNVSVGANVIDDALHEIIDLRAQLTTAIKAPKKKRKAA